MAPLLAHGGLALVAAAFAAAVFVLGVYWIWRRRRDPVETERRRRLEVNTTGRMTDGAIVDVQQTDTGGLHSTTLIFYEYSVRGVDYSTAQDVSAIDQTAGGDFAHCLGSAYVKYQSKNPSDSIVVCEDWSGLHKASRDPVESA